MQDDEPNDCIGSFLNIDDIMAENDNTDKRFLEVGKTEMDKI